MRAMMNRIFYGRTGVDQLNGAFLCLAILCMVISRLARIYMLRSLFYYGFLFAAAIFLVRAFSRNLGRRQMENQRFLDHMNRWRSGPAAWRARSAQRRAYKIFKCPSCGLKLRVPRGKGKVRITCRQCGASFEEKS